MSFDQYWADPRFRAKRPNLHGSRKQAFGDNIYHKDPNTELWLQVDSHHCHDDGTPNSKNIDNDTQTDRILIGEDFIYWGGDGPEIPKFHGTDICKKGPGHKSNFTDEEVQAFVEWVRSFGEGGYFGKPPRWN